MTKRILITGLSVPKKQIERLEEAGFEVDNPRELLTEQQLTEKLKDATAYLLGGDEVATATAIQAANDLKVIAYLGMGYQSGMDVDAVRAKGIPITYTPGTLSTSTAEFTIGHLLNLRRTITAQNNLLKHGMAGEVEQSYELANKQLGIIGLGGVGTATAKIAARGFGMNVVYFNRTKRPEVEAELDIAFLELDELLKTSDVVVVLVPDNAETRGMIGSREFGLMKEGALLINTARPFVVEPYALKEALISGKLGGASMDNYYVNPYPAVQDDPYGLLSLPDNKFIVTAWTGSFTFEARDAMSEMACSSIINIVSGREDPNIVQF